jgi:hypothetical protein
VANGNTANTVTRLVNKDVSIFTIHGIKMEKEWRKNEKRMKKE